MLENTWIIWLVLFVGSLILEAFTMQLFSIWFAVGALAGVVAAVAGAQHWLQILIFVLTTAVSLLATRPLVKRLQKNKAAPTNADRCLDQEAIVLEEIDNMRGTGQIKVLGQTWSARTPDGTVIPEGALVRTLSIQGARMFVEPAQANPN